MSDENTEVVDTEVEDTTRNVVVDDVSYPVDDLPQGIQNAINTYNVWVRDQNEAQKTAAQMTSAVQHLAGQITEAIKQHVAAANEESGEVATSGEDEAAVVEDASSAALDIPAEE